MQIQHIVYMMILDFSVWNDSLAFNYVSSVIGNYPGMDRIDIQLTFSSDVLFNQISQPAFKI